LSTYIVIYKLKLNSYVNIRPSTKSLYCMYLDHTACFDDELRLTVPLCALHISLVAVVIDGYTHNSTLTSGDSVPLGTQIILVCRVVGLPYGTPLSYTWTCPLGQCSFEGNYATTIHNEHILAVNMTIPSYAGAYTCQVTANDRQDGSFTLHVSGTFDTQRMHTHVCTATAKGEGLHTVAMLTAEPPSRPKGQLHLEV